jgi:hypothetical protein
MRLAKETCKRNNAACVTIIVPQSELVWPSRIAFNLVIALFGRTFNTQIGLTAVGYVA